MRLTLISTDYSAGFIRKSQAETVRGQRSGAPRCVKQGRGDEAEGKDRKSKASGKPKKGSVEGSMWVHDNLQVFPMSPSSSGATKVCLQITQISPDRLLVGIHLTL